MAAITTTAIGSSFRIVGEDIDNGEVDSYWFVIPQWAKYAKIYFVMEVVGTSVQLSLHEIPPFDRDDDHAILLREAPAFAALTSADVTSVVDIGPGVTGIADDVTGAAAADSYASINCILPDILGVKVTAVGANNTYDLAVLLRP